MSDENQLFLISNRSALIFFGSIFIGGIILLTVINRLERNGSNKYFRSLNLELTGIVRDKQVVTNGAGLLYVDVRNTSIKDYDIRANTSYYYCVIHKGKAEILESISEIYIGDSIVVDSKIDSFKCFRNGELIRKWRLRLIYFPPINEGVKKIHRL
jgi:hypothetical protein